MGDFTVNCPQCQENLMVSTDFIGQDVSCPSCNFVFKLNAPAAPGAPVPPAPQMAPGAPVPPAPQMAPGAPVPPQMSPGMVPGAPMPPKPKAPFNFMLFKMIASGVSLLLAFIMFAIVTCMVLFGDTPRGDYPESSNSSYDGSVSVGQSSYATYKNAKVIVWNTRYIITGMNNAEQNKILSNWGYFFLILAVVFAVFPKPETRKKDN